MCYRTIIPAHLDSTRIPQKALASIGGVPLAAHTYNSVRSAGIACHVLSDSAIICDAVEKFRGYAIYDDEPAATGTERIASWRRRNAGYKQDIWVNVQLDQPEINPLWIDCLVQEMKENDWDMATIATDLDWGKLDDFNMVRVVVQGSRCVDFTREGCRGDMFAHVGVYAYRDPVLQQWHRFIKDRARRHSLEQLAAVDAGVKMGLLYVEDAQLGINTPSDLDMLRRRALAGA